MEATVIAGYPGDGVSLVQLTSSPVRTQCVRSAGTRRTQCWHCSGQASTQRVERDEVFADLEIRPISPAEERQIYSAVMSGRPVRPGLVARLWRHAQLWHT